MRRPTTDWSGTARCSQLVTHRSLVLPMPGPFLQPLLPVQSRFSCETNGNPGLYLWNVLILGRLPLGRCVIPKDHALAFGFGEQCQSKGRGVSSIFLLKSSPWSLLFPISEGTFPLQFSWATGTSLVFLRFPGELAETCRPHSAHPQTRCFPCSDSEGGRFN